MSNSEMPKVMILGKGKNRNAKEINSIMTSVDPVLIPASLVEGMYITFSDDETIKVEKRHLGAGVDYQNIEGTLRQLGIDRKIRLIEIVVDLDLAHQLLQTRSDLILKPLFED